jgi:hypothetical protein
MHATNVLNLTVNLLVHGRDLIVTARKHFPSDHALNLIVNILITFPGSVT